MKMKLIGGPAAGDVYDVPTHHEGIEVVVPTELVPCNYFSVSEESPSTYTVTKEIYRRKRWKFSCGDTHMFFVHNSITSEDDMIRDLYAGYKEGPEKPSYYQQQDLDEMNSRLADSYKENEKLRNLLEEKILEYAVKGAK